MVEIFVGGNVGFRVGNFVGRGTGFVVIGALELSELQGV